MSARVGPESVLPGAVAQRGDAVLKRDGLRRDYVLTFATEFTILASMVLVYRLAARYWNPVGFAEYALVRRTVNLIQLPLLLGAAIGIPRYIAIRRAEEGAAAVADRYFLAGLALCVVSVGVVVGLLNGFAGPAAYLLFGSSTYDGLAHAITPAVAGISAHVLAYSYFRGYQRMGRANALQLLNLGVLPPLVFLIPGLSVSQLISIVGLAWLLVSTVVIGALLLSCGPGTWELRAMRVSLRELLQFGLGRVPGEVALAALLVVPATLVAHEAGVTAGGFVAFSITILNAVGSGFAPIGLVLLPQASAMAARRDFARLRRLLVRLILVAGGLTASFVLVFELVGGWALQHYLGPGFEPVLAPARIIVPGVIPYVVYIVLRNALDAMHVPPLNTKNLLLALGLFLAIAARGPSPGTVAVGLVLALTALGAVTALDARRLLAARGA